MNLLGIDASGVAGSIAYIKDNKLCGEYYICDKLTHSQTIMPMLEHIKELLEIDLSEIDAIAVTAGPGSFTGLRIGVTAAKTLALALEVPLIGIPTLDVIAGAMSMTTSLICPLMDARRNQVYTALYQGEMGSIRRVSDYQAIDIEVYVQQLKAQEQEIIFLGDGAPVFKELIKEQLGDKAFFAPDFINLQHASVLAEEACKRFERGEAVDPSEFIPMYLRKSQAEREKEEREKHGH